MEILDTKHHATIGLMNWKRLETLAKSNGKSPCQLLTEWYKDPSTAPPWFLKGMAIARHRFIAKRTSRSMTRERRGTRASTAAAAKHAKEKWKNDPEKMRAAFADLEQKAGTATFRAVALALGIDPASFTNAGPAEYTAFIVMRDNLGLKPKRVSKKAK